MILCRKLILLEVNRTGTYAHFYIITDEEPKIHVVGFVRCKEYKDCDTYGHC
jgi:hypothetical protein